MGEAQGNKVKTEMRNKRVHITEDAHAGVSEMEVCTTWGRQGTKVQYKKKAKWGCI